MAKAGRDNCGLSDVAVVSRSAVRTERRQRSRRSVDTRLLQQLRQHHLYTAQHSMRVHDLVSRVAQQLQLDSRAANHARRVALLHDVGKVVVPVSLLDGSGRPTDEEFALLQEHSNAGDDMLRRAGVDESVARAVRAVHERLDGNGYPDGLAGDEIPLATRMVAACDAFDAISAPGRNYQRTRSAQDALQILESEPEHFDAEVVAALRLVVEQ